MFNIENFDAFRFVENLKFMGVGMLGVFIIIGIIIASTYIIGAATTKKSNNND